MLLFNRRIEKTSNKLLMIYHLRKMNGIDYLNKMKLSRCHIPYEW